MSSEEPDAQGADETSSDGEIPAEPTITLEEFEAELAAIRLVWPGEEEEEDLSDEEELDDGSDAAAAAAAERRPPNELLKRPARHEDPAWIAQQRAERADSLEDPEDSPWDAWPDILELYAVDESECVEPPEATMTAPLPQPQDGAGASGAALANPLFCVSRIWGGGWGGQCTSVRLPRGELCIMHARQLRRQGYLTHGRIDGPIPPKKRLEFQKWQSILLRRPGSAAQAAAGAADNANPAVMLNDEPGFEEAQWRAMCRGQGESGRAYLYRTGRSSPERPRALRDAPGRGQRRGQELAKPPPARKDAESRPKRKGQEGPRGPKHKKRPCCSGNKSN